MSLHSLPLKRGYWAMLIPRGKGRNKVGRFFFLYCFVSTSSSGLSSFSLSPLVKLPALCMVVALLGLLNPPVELDYGPQLPITERNNALKSLV